MKKGKNITKRMCKKCGKYHITLLNGDEVQLTEEEYNHHLKGNEQKLQSSDDLEDHITQKNREFRETLSYSKSITEETLLEGREENIPIVLDVLFNWFKDNFNRRQSKSQDKKELLKREIETLEKLFDPNQDLSNPTYLEVVRAIPIYSFQKYLIEEDYERVQKFKSKYGKINLQSEEGAKTYNLDYDKTVNENGTEIKLLESLLKSWEEIFDRKEISFPAAKDIRKYYNDIIVQGQDSYYEKRNYFKNEKLDFHKLEAVAMHKYLEWLNKKQQPQPIQTKSGVLKENLQKSVSCNSDKEEEFSNKIKKHFAFFIGNCPRKHKQILGDKDFNNLIKWTIEYFKNNFKVPEISEPIEVVNTNKTYVQLAFKYLFKRLHKDSTYPDTLFEFYKSAFSPYSEDKRKNFEAVKNNDEVKKLMKINY